MKRNKRGSFGYTKKHHESSGHTNALLGLKSAIDAHAEFGRGNCRIALRRAAEGLRVLGRAFQDYHAAGGDAFRDDSDFVGANRRLDAVLINIENHCMKG